jgi:prepilin-type N-terminal cleavage/methylation domain-containing protein
VKRADRAFTLVEILAVLALLGLLAGLGSTFALRQLRQDPLATATAALARQLQAARLLARQGAGATITLGPAGLGLPDPAATFPEAVTCHWRSAGDPRGREPTRWPLDGRGRGPDLRVRLQAGTVTKELLIAGLSGLLLPGDDG